MLKGYDTPDGYYGKLPWNGEWMLFPTEEEYIHYVKEEEQN